MSPSVTSLWTPRSMDIDWPRPLILVCCETRKPGNSVKVVRKENLAKSHGLS